MQIAVDSFVGAGGGWGRTEDVIPIVVDYCSPKKKKMTDALTLNMVSIQELAPPEGAAQRSRSRL